MTDQCEPIPEREPGDLLVNGFMMKEGDSYCYYLPITWQPRDSAPKSGSRILACTGGRVQIIRWEYGDWWDDAQVRVAYPPEYWVPLPEAPSDRASYD